MGSSTEHSAFGPTRNPVDPSRTPGGSSGGSAATVAAGAVPIALGSDTGGSVRQPASFCGVVGVKPTYGRVSRYGLIAFASSLDQVGVFSRTARDAALVLQAIAGADPCDATAARRPVPDYTAALDGRGARAARRRAPRAAGRRRGRGGASTRSTRRSRRCADLGLAIGDVALPHSRVGDPGLLPGGHRRGQRQPGALRRRALRVPRAARRVAGRPVRTDPGRGIRARGEASDHAGHLRAQRRLLRRVLPEGAAGPDADPRGLRRRVSRSRPRRPAHLARRRRFRLGERLDDPVRMYLADLFTAGPSLAGLPAMSVPCGTTKGGLPVGLQLVGRMFDETGLLRVAAALEGAQDTPSGAR